MRWLLLVLLAPFWLPRWLVHWASWRRSKRATLHVVLRGALPDLAAPRGLLGLLRPAVGPELISLLEGLAAAAEDDRLSTVLVRIEELSCGLARAEEVRAALARVRAAGKQVIVHADELGLGAYWIALGASSIRLSPMGSLNVSGVAMDFTLLQGLLSRVGVRAQLLARGKYKSYRDMFTEPALTEATREMLTSLVADLSGQLTTLVSSARHQAPEAAHGHIHRGPCRAEEARELGLVDVTQYWDELWQELGGEEQRVQGWAAYRKALGKRRWLPRRRTQIGLLRISGNIRMGNDRHGPNGPRATGHRSLARALGRLTRSSRTRAIVVRVDSPGGSALASDLMWRELTRAAGKKPLFVSMVNSAASGGYYTSALAGVPVWASPTTLTGSIGVVGGKFEISELLAKVGVGSASITSGPHANFYSAMHPWQTAELEKLEHDLDALYRDFVGKMAAGRGLSYEAVHAVAQGRVWTGRQARDVSLVDQLGGLHEVAVAVREKLGLGPDAGLRWTSAAPSTRLGIERESSAEELAGPLGAALGALPELAPALDCALDLSGERLLLLSPLWPRIRG
ncbi:MAG: S49 family peptidase [Deltaproteobacteria bacterium]